MKQGWTYKKLGEVATFARGLTYSKNDEVESSNNIVLRSNNIDLVAGKLDFSELKYLKTNFAVPDEKKLHKGSLFICMSNGSKAHLGKVAYVDKDYGYAFGGFMGQITPNDEINGLYLHYALSSPYYKEYIKSLSEGANINNLKYKDLSEFIIKYPPLPEQQRIVSRLDSAFAHIDELKANAEKQVNEARALFQKALSKAMEPKEGWEEKKIRDVFKIVGGGTPSKSKSTYYNGNIPWATVRDMNCDYLNKTEYSISEEGLHNSSSNLIDKGEIIIATRVGLGKVCILSQATAINQDLKAIVPKGNNINRNFVYYFFKDKAKYIEDNGVGATVKGVKLTFIEELDFPLVSPSEQQRIVSRLDFLSKNVKALEENQRKVMAECDALKQALLRKVFE